MQVRKCINSDLASLAKFNKCLIEDEKSDNKMNEKELYQRQLQYEYMPEI